MNVVNVSMPGPAAAELAGAGSFFGSCQVEAGNFQAALQGAEQNLAEGEEIAEPGSDLGDTLAGMTSEKSEVLQMLEALLGEEGAAAYKDLVKLFDKGALSEEVGVDGEMNLEALSLVLQQLVAQLENLLAQVSAGTEVSEPTSGNEDSNSMLAALSPQQLTDLQKQAKELLGELQEMLAQSGMESVPTDVALVDDMDEDAGGEAVAESGRETVDSAVMITGDVVTGDQKSIDTSASQDQDNFGDALKAAVENVDAEESEEGVDPVEELTAEAAGPADSESKPVLETVVRYEGGELRFETVDAKTGTKVSSSAVPDQQKRIQEFEVVRQVSEKVRYLVSQGSQTMTVQLRPEQLGQVDLHIMLKDGQMQVHAKVASEVAQQALESNTALLRESLEKQNIALDSLEVSVDRQRADAGAAGQQQQGGERNGRSRRQGNTGFTDGRLLVAVKRQGAETGRRLGYNTMEYLA